MASNNSAYRSKNYGKVVRRDYGKITQGHDDVPYLLEGSHRSYQQFVKEGLKEVFNEIFPIESSAKIEDGLSRWNLNLKKVWLEKPELSIQQTKYNDRTYSQSIYASIHLVDNATGEVKTWTKRKGKARNKNDIYFGELPLMTPKGTFVINGTEKVIISNLTLGYGVIFNRNNDKRDSSYVAKIIPIRGKWITFELNEKYEKKHSLENDVEWREPYWIVNVSIDKSVSTSATSLFRVLGIVKNQEILSLFQNRYILQKTIYEEIKRMMKPLSPGINEIQFEAFVHDNQVFDDFVFRIIKSFVLSRLFFNEHYFPVSVHKRLKKFRKPTKANVIQTWEKEMELIRRSYLREDVKTLIEQFIAVPNFDDLLVDETTGEQIKVTTVIDRLDNNHDLLDEVVHTVALKEKKAVASNYIGSHSLDSWSMICKNMVAVALQKPDELSLSEFLLLSSSAYLIDLLMSNSKSETKSLKKFIGVNDIARVRHTFEQTFFKANYDLTKSGRFKLKRKLRVTERIYHKVLATDVFAKNGKPLTYLNDAGEATPIKKGTFITTRVFNVLKEALKNNELAIVKKLVLYDINRPTKKPEVTYEELRVFEDPEQQSEDDVVKIIGIEQDNESKLLSMGDLVSCCNYLLCLNRGIGREDDEYHLGNRKVRSISELLFNQFRLGLSRMRKNVLDKFGTVEEGKITLRSILNVKPLVSAVNEFFNVSQFVQFLDQVNPLSELSNKRRLTSIGSIGKEHKRSIEPHDVHDSHYGKICPIETPEGQNIGLIHNLGVYAKINDMGFLTTPYFVVVDGRITDKKVYLDAWQETEYIIAGANVNKSANNEILDEKIVARYRGKFELRDKEEVSFIEISPKQGISFAASTIPFIEHDDGNRALMGTNMQKQAVPLIRPEAPIIGTGIEHTIARDSGFAMVASVPGTVTYVDSSKIIIKGENRRSQTYELIKFDRTNQETCMNHRPIVEIGQQVEANEIIADGLAIDQGELALGQNMFVAFTTWNGYNFEDAIIISERLVKDDVYTSLHIQEYTVQRRRTKLGEEQITRDVPNAAENSKHYLDEDGIIMPGAEVEMGDILVGKVTPRGQIELSAEDRLLRAIFGEKTRNIKDSSLRLPHGGHGVVLSVKRLPKNSSNILESDILETVKIRVVQKRKIQVGDKMAGRHGNKGVVSIVLPVEDMPHLKDGTPVDIVLNPLGVPSRMNIGQILELHLGLAAHQLGIKVATPAFEGATKEEIASAMAAANLPANGKFPLYDGRTGELIGSEIALGVMYMLKLSHMVEDKIHARSVGPYSLITQQPLGGKSHNGGQRLGEMEVWALEAYGAAYTLREMLTIKSDDIKGRIRTYDAIVRGRKIPEPATPASFRVLENELRGLGFYIELEDKKGEFREIETYQEQINKED